MENFKYTDRLKKTRDNILNTNKEVIKFKELLDEEITSGKLECEIRFKDVYGEDFDGEFENTPVINWMKLNGIKWQWEDHCLGVLDGYYIINMMDL